MKTIHIIAGPTASGKSVRALALAADIGGIIINCDSLQIYDGLPILTAQPSAAEKASVPHKLYGALHPNAASSAGLWCAMAQEMIEEAFRNRQAPIIVGGTGLYIKVLTEGLSPIPEIPPDIRNAVIKKQQELGNPAFHAALAKRDPIMASRLHPLHTARLVRALEVLEATTKSLAEWQEIPRLGPPEDWYFKVELIMPERADLLGRCDRRFLKMLDQGVLEEAEDFVKKIESGEVREDVPLTRALGFRSLRRHIKGEISKDEAITLAQTETRQYAKRQVTWFRHQL